ncbi:MAG TPA: ribosome maturation factor RimP [Negativicutes bacterium]|nr:ribosome maturation factor RimP [Negativicutes bacterium]
MAKKKIEPLVEELVADIIKGSDLELVDVEFVKERDWYLRVFLDKAGGIEIEDCRRVSEALEKKLDALDPIEQSYYLEVSSPGLDRPLKKARDFTRHTGDIVEIHTFTPLNGQKEFIGELRGLREGVITILQDNQEVDIPQEKAALVRLHISF